MPNTPSFPNQPDGSEGATGLPAAVPLVATACLPRARTPWWLWVLLVGLVGAVAYIQQPGPPDQQDAAAHAAGQTVDPPDDNLKLVGKLSIAGKSVLGPSASMLQNIADSLVGWEPQNPMGAPLGPGNPPKPRTAPFSAADRVRVAIISGEVAGPEAVLTRLDFVEHDPKLAADSPLRADIAALRVLYLTRAADPIAHPSSSGLTMEQRSDLRENHGWFAELALSNEDPDAPVRAKARQDGTLILTIVGLGVVLAGVAVFAGLVLLIIAAVSYRQLRPRMVHPLTEPNVPTGPPHWVWLETVVVFVAGFLALKLGIETLNWIAPDASWLGWASLLGQWLLLLTIFWPRLRGMDWDTWKRHSGWHAGRGVGREVLAGLAAYLAALPIYFGMALVVVVISFLIGQIVGGESPLPEGNRVTDLVSGGGPLMIAMVFLLATVWAPVVEESIFRGALYRSLRRRWAVVFAAFGSAAVFAVMHAYILQGLLMVGTLGMMFAIIREWRGSIIACVTAHAIHNGVVLTILIAVLSMAKD